MATLACNREVPQDPGFLSFFDSLPEKSSATIRFFERSDYYTVHGSDAVFVAQDVFKTLSVLKYLGQGTVKTEYVCLSKLNFESLVRDLLLVRHCKVEIYRNKGVGKSQEWTLECKASPGNLTALEEVLFNTDNAVVNSSGAIAVKISATGKEQLVGIAFGDPIMREFTISEFTDSSSLLELEAILVQLCPKECLLAPFPDQCISNEVKQIVKRHNILLTECKAGDFNPKDILQDLDRLIRGNAQTTVKGALMTEIDQRLAVSCVAALIKYFELLSDEANFGQFTLRTFDSKSYMKLDVATVKALGLFPKSVEESKSHSLFGLLNKCRTSQGQRLLNQWIKQPLLNVNRIEERYNIVESLIRDSDLRHALSENHLRKMLDLELMAKKFQRRKADLMDLYKIYAMMIELKALNNSIGHHKGPYETVLKVIIWSEIEDGLVDFVSYQDMVKTVLDVDAVANGEFIVRSDIDPKLKELRDLMKESQELIGTEINKVARDLGLEANKTVKLENCQQIGYYFRVTRKEEKTLRNRSNYFTIDTKQNGVRFYNTSLKNLNEKYLSLRKSYEEYQGEIVAKVVDVAASYYAPMKLINDTVALLDVLVSFACTAFNAPKSYTRPKLTSKGERGILLKQARHPCLEVQPNIDFIPNDVQLEKGKCVFSIITGPNMGGKSTFIQSAALNVLMAQIGCFVPCDVAEISVVDAILTRVGAGDRPLKGVSTFMAEMLEVKSILKSATEDSLIIVDELGRGTSTYDGLGLAWAISEHISRNICSYCLFTTHFHELSALSDEMESVNNLHVTAMTSDGAITFLYRVKPGVCDQSFGIHVAEMAHFPKSVIEYAKAKVKELEEFEKSCLISNEGEPKLKKRKADAQGTQNIIKEFLSNAAEFAFLAKGDAINALNGLKDDLQSSCNPFIQKMVDKCPKI